tara:strand:+ start:1040 stop:1279 length:240 start_codon:yes stop_codon:yes gene_type:complete
MSHFYASIPVSARKTTATARGHKSTGLTVKAASWSGAIEVEFKHNEETGLDEFVVRHVTHENHGINATIAEGCVGRVAS